MKRRQAPRQHRLKKIKLAAGESPPPKSLFCGLSKDSERQPGAKLHTAVGVKAENLSRGTRPNRAGGDAKAVMVECIHNFPPQLKLSCFAKRGNLEYLGQRQVDVSLRGSPERAAQILAKCSGRRLNIC